MTTKRKAELQRRLSMASVPKPPAGLADRIKRDIPELLDTTRDRERFSRSAVASHCLKRSSRVVVHISSSPGSISCAD